MTQKSPDEEVANRITDALAKAQLLPVESLANLRALLLEGKMTAEEWKFLLEPIEAKSEDNDC